MPGLLDTLGALIDVETPTKVARASASGGVPVETVVEQILIAVAQCLHLSGTDETTREQSDLKLQTYLPRAILLLDAVCLQALTILNIVAGASLRIATV